MSIADVHCSGGLFSHHHCYLHGGLLHTHISVSSAFLAYLPTFLEIPTNPYLLQGPQMYATFPI